MKTRKAGVNRRRGSKTTRRGFAPGTWRVVSSGSSAATVPAPTSTASQRARSRCMCTMLSSPVTVCESPEGVAMNPSRLWPRWPSVSGRADVALQIGRYRLSISERGSSGARRDSQPVPWMPCQHGISAVRAFAKVGSLATRLASTGWSVRIRGPTRRGLAGAFGVGGARQRPHAGDLVLAEHLEPARAVESVGQGARRAQQAPRRIHGRAGLKRGCRSERHITGHFVTDLTWDARAACRGRPR